MSGEARCARVHTNSFWPFAFDVLGPLIGRSGSLGRSGDSKKQHFLALLGDQAVHWCQVSQGVRVYAQIPTDHLLLIARYQL